jgi:esterase/lipase superfamily enzyme
VDGPAVALKEAVVYAWTNEPDLAFKGLETLSKIPYGVFYNQIKLGPYFDRLRTNPRYERLAWELMIDGDMTAPAPQRVVNVQIEGRESGPGGDVLPTPDAARMYPVWYATNRKLVKPNATEGSYAPRRSEHGEVYYGVCKVVIPKCHTIGSIGSPWWKRILTLSDDRLRICEHFVLDEAVYWEKIREQLSQWEQRERVALVFVHGYNVTFDGAAIRAAQLGVDLKVPLTAFFSWPSKGTVAGYIADSASIEASEGFIRDFLTRFTQQSGAERVHLIAHSLGNRGLLRSLHAMAQSAARSSKIPFGQIFLAAPDVDVGVFRNLARAYTALAQRTTLYVSTKDQALASSGKLSDYPRAGYVPPITIIPGIDTIEVSEVDISLLGHGYFAEARDLLNDIYVQIWQGQPPPRFGLEPTLTADGRQYWRIRK